jgi:hypothetical protein
MREGTTSRVMAADRPYGTFYDVYSVSLEILHQPLYIVVEYKSCRVKD